MAKAHHRRSFDWDKNLPWIIVFSAVAIVIVGVFGPTGMFTGVAQEAGYVVGQNGLILKSTDGGAGGGTGGGGLGGGVGFS